MWNRHVIPSLLLLVGTAEIAWSKMICTGDLSNRRIAVSLGVPVTKACLTEDQGGARMSVVLHEVTQDLPGRVDKIVRGDEVQYSTKTRLGEKLLLVNVQMKPKDRIRFEGAMADHFVGSIRITEEGSAQPEAFLEGIHFYSGHPEHDIHWGYQAENGPGFWGKLNAQWETCLTGTQQSPVALSTPNALMDAAAPLHINYKPLPASMINNGHALQINLPEGSGFSINGRNYQLLQFHAHTPSEHSVDGKVYPMEIHLVHEAPDKSKAVIGVLVDSPPGTTPDEALAAALNEFPRRVNDPKEFSRRVDPSRWLPPQDRRSYFTYAGSLTTPPCSEGVTWFVLKEPIHIAKEQVRLIEQLIGGPNARQLDEGRLMPLDGRRVHLHQGEPPRGP